jgi:WD40 repeat protein
MRMTGHAANVTSLAFSPDGSRLASGSLDGTVKLWDVATGQEVLTLTGHNGPVTGVAFAPDHQGRWLASCGDDGSVRVWEANTP